MKKIALLAFVLWVLIVWALCGQQKAYYGHSGGANGPLLPDPLVTPGAVRTTDKNEICAAGFTTKKYRHTTGQMKTQAYLEYGAMKKAGVCCEVDHLIPLELGGLDDIADLWPQPYQPAPAAHEKDHLENFLRAQVCNGKISLPDAQSCIANDWYVCYVRFGLNKEYGFAAPCNCGHACERGECGVIGCDRAR